MWGGALNLNGGGVAAPTVAGFFCSAWVWGDYKVSGQLITAAELGVRGGNLDINGGRVDVGGPDGGLMTGTFYTTLGGTLTMTNAADLLIVGGSGVLFNGGSETGRLTAGVIKQIGGQFNTTTGASDAFFATGTHRVVFASDITVATAGNTHAFNDLELGVGTTTTITGTTNVYGTLSRSATGTGTTTIQSSSGNHFLNAGGLNFSSAQPTVISGALVGLIDGAASTTFDGVTFTGYTSASGGALFTVNRAAGPLTFNQLHFGGAGFTATSAEHFVANLGAANITINNSGPATPANGTNTIHYVKLGSGTVTWGTPP